MNSSSISSQIATRLFQSFLADLMTDFLILDKKLNQGKLLASKTETLEYGLQLDYSVLKPSKKISKAEYQDLLTLYALAWMVVHAETVLMDAYDVERHAFLGATLFYAHIKDQGIIESNQNLKAYEKRIKEIISKYKSTKLFDEMKIVAEEASKNPFPSGFPILQLLNHKMKFAAFS